MEEEPHDLRERIEKLEATLALSEVRLKRLERLAGTGQAAVPAEAVPAPSAMPPPPPAAEVPQAPPPAYWVTSSHEGDVSSPERPPLQFPQLSSELEAAIGTSWLNRLGIVAIITAIAYFLKYAFDNNWIGPAGRVAITLLAGAILLGLGERFQRQKLPLFAQGLTGGGIAVLYFGVFAAFATYRLIGLPPAFGTMMLITIAAVLLALRYESTAIAILGLFGGFATPLALGGDTTGTPAPVSAALYLYFLLLDAGAYVVARHKGWWQFGGAALAAGFLIPVVVGTSGTPHSPAAAAYFLLATVATLALAVAYRVAALAWAALAGGFVLSTLAGVGSFAGENPVAALGYYATVTLAALAVADRHNWQGVAVMSAVAGIIAGVFVSYERTLPGFIFLILLSAVSLLISVRRRWPWLELTVLAAVALSATVIAEAALSGGPEMSRAIALSGVTILFVLFTGAAALASREAIEWRSLLAVLATAVYGGQLYLILGPGNPDFLALAAVAVAAYHVAVSRIVIRRAFPLLTVLVFLGLAITALTIAIPLKLRQEAIPLAWTVEIVMLAWAARRTGNTWAIRAAAVVGLIVVLRLLLVEASAVSRAGLVLTPPGLAFLAGVTGLAIAARLLRAVHSEREEDRYLAPGLGATAAALLFVWGILEITGAYTRMPTGTDVESAKQFTLSAWFTLYGFGLIVAGFVRATPAARWAGIGLLGVTIVKVFVVDLAQVSVAFRIMSLGVLGVLLLLASFVYNRYRGRLEEPHTQAGGRV